MSIIHLRPIPQYPVDVARIKAEMNAVKAENPILRAMKKTRATPHMAARADGKRAVYVFSPNRLKTVEATQKYRGGFSRKGSPFSLGTIMSPDLTISVAIPATLGSSEPHKWGYSRPTR
jgi:hypothetical protein